MEVDRDAAAQTRIDIVRVIMSHLFGLIQSRSVADSGVCVVFFCIVRFASCYLVIWLNIYCLMAVFSHRILCAEFTGMRKTFSNVLLLATPNK